MNRFWGLLIAVVLGTAGILFAAIMSSAIVSNAEDTNLNPESYVCDDYNKYQNPMFTQATQIPPVTSPYISVYFSANQGRNWTLRAAAVPERLDIIVRATRSVRVRDIEITNQRGSLVSDLAVTRVDPDNPNALVGGTLVSGPGYRGNLGITIVPRQPGPGSILAETAVRLTPAPLFVFEPGRHVIEFTILYTVDNVTGTGYTHGSFRVSRPNNNQLNLILTAPPESGGWGIWMLIFGLAALGALAAGIYATNWLQQNTRNRARLRYEKAAAQRKSVEAQNFAQMTSTEKGADDAIKDDT